MTTTMWRFYTKQFEIAWEIDECFDLDLRWDTDGEVKEKLESGEYTAFDSCVYVRFAGDRIGEDHLGSSIYADPADFRDHIGIKKHPNCGSYFSDMVREAIREARKFIRKSQQVQLRKGQGQCD